jgi:AAA15 family ATPase/GTPase
MILKALKYSGTKPGPDFWSIVGGGINSDFVEFENINLIVGRNASGKTRIMQLIRWISDLLYNDSTIGVIHRKNNSFEVNFQDNEDKINYNVEFDNNQSVIQETLYINNQVKFNRKAGKLYYENLGQFLDFETNNKYLGINRRDKTQQPFFDILHNWGKNLALYSFGGDMGLSTGRSDIEDLEHPDLMNFKNSNHVKPIYSKGLRDFGNLFEQIIIDDMSKIEYFLQSISLTIIREYAFLEVQEKDLFEGTDFDNMSQGMARAFSLIVQLNYSLMAKIPSCILIDDIGEGLDYDRSKKLIELIIEKAEGSNIQVFMTTNDRFVMNSVPLKYWSVIHREGNKSVFYNYQNSKQTFDDFALTGFNNFDFFATEFYRLGFEEFIQTA